MGVPERPLAICEICVELSWDILADEVDGKLTWEAFRALEPARKAEVEAQFADAMRRSKGVSRPIEPRLRVLLL